jgi:hypothetical protein
MLEFLLVLSYILLLILWKNNSKSNKEIERLKVELLKLEFKLTNFIQSKDSKPIEKEEHQIEQKLDITPKVESSKHLSIIPKQPLPIIQKIQAKTTPLIDKLSVLRNQIIDNWTGIVGSTVLVIGTGFLGLYAAIMMSEIFRVLLIVLFAAFIYAISIYLYKKLNQEKLSEILESAASTIFLFAMVGAGYAQGLKFLNEIPAIIALLIGIFINLFIGYRKDSSTKAIFHLVLILITLSILPSSIFILIIGTTLTILVQLNNYKKNWEYHLLISSTSYFIFHLIILNNLNLTDNNYLRITGILGSLLVFGQSIFVPYLNKKYYNIKLSKYPLITHILSWIYIGILLSMYSTGQPIYSLVILTAAIFLYFFSTKAKNNNTEWLYYSDKIVSLILFFVAVLHFLNYEINPSLVFLISFSGIIFYFYETLKKQDKILTISAYGAINIYTLIHIGILIEGIYEEPKVFSWGIIYSSIYFPIQLLSQTLLEKKWKSNINSYFFDFSRLFSFLGILLICIYYFDHSYSGLLFIGLLSFIYFIQKLLFTQRTTFGILGFLIIMYSMNWIRMEEQHPPSIIIPFLINSLIFLIGGFITYLFFEWKNKKVQAIGIYTILFHLIIFFYFLTISYTDILPGLIYLSFIPIVFQMSQFLPKNKIHIRSSGYILLIIFIFRHIFVHLQAEFNLFHLPVRTWIEVYALCMFIYFYSKPSGTSFYIRKTGNLKNYFLELILLFIVFVIISTLSDNWYSFAFSLIALILYYFSFNSKDIKRLNYYSKGFFLTSNFYLAFLSGTSDNPNISFVNEFKIGGGLTLIVLITYISLSYLKQKNKQEINLWNESFNKYYYSFIFYPFVLSIFLYLNSNFTGSILTLSWTFLGFLIFVLGIFLKESHFTYSSALIFIICLIKLFFKDLSGANTIQKALVFIGIGFLLILTNFLYSKYKNRLSE